MRGATVTGHTSPVGCDPSLDVHTPAADLDQNRLLNRFKYRDLTFEAERPTRDASICLDPRKPIVFIETFFNEELDTTRSRDLCKGQLSFG